MERISKRLYAAAKFAGKIQDNGTAPGLANYKAGKYYGFSDTEVAEARNKLKSIYKDKGCKTVKKSSTDNMPKPCPYCGSTKYYAGWETEFGEKVAYYVQCDGCTQAASGFVRTDDEALHAWNRWCSNDDVIKMAAISKAAGKTPVQGLTAAYIMKHFPDVIKELADANEARCKYIVNGGDNLK